MQQRLLSRLLFGALAVLGANAHAAPCAGFNDVDDSSAFCTSIAWMKNRAITLGCGDGTIYCPADFVRRDQMAAFMYRLGFQNAFLRGGNAFGATAVLGTTDGQPLDIVVNGARAMRFQPMATGSPSILGGHVNNAVTNDREGQVIGGGGGGGSNCVNPETNANDRSCANVTTALYATIGGGIANIAGGFATNSGGLSNTASGNFSIVSGGLRNTAAGGLSAILGGSGNVASGEAAAVLGGAFNTASAFLGLAAGRFAEANQTQCMVFSAWSGGSAFDCLGATNILRFGGDHGLSVDYRDRRPDGGGTRWVYFGDNFAGSTISTWMGAHLTDAGIWVDASSSRDGKTDFAAVDANDVLEKVAALPITTWRYREGEGEVRHIGPMAEDFHAAFDVGYGPHTIADLDARGVALAAIQGLHRQVRERDARVTALEAQMAELQRTVRELTATAASQRAKLEER